MRQSLVIFFFMLLINISAVAQIQVMVWNDEFSNTGLPDATHWGYDVGGSGWGNNELEYYTDSRLENARCQNGNLIIEARKESYQGMGYTSARLVTTNKGDWRYGRFEVRAKLPGGKGTWPAIWMLPTSWVYGGWPSSGEIDIMEYVGYDPGNVHGSIHTEAYNHTIGTQKTSTYSVPDAETAFHTYAIEWTSEKIDFYVDNVKYFSFANEHTGYKVWPFDQSFHFILNLAVGGDWGGAQGVDPNIWPQQMVVDYARVYQYITKDQIAVDGPTNVAPNAAGLVFKTQNIVGATYQWTVPSGASIVSGSGTNQILVNWGTSSGNVQVQITHPDAGGNYSKSVSVISSPSGDRYTLVDFSTSGIEGWNPYTNGGNTITLSKQDTLLLLKYNILDPSVNPYVDYTFPNPVSMATLSNLAIWMKTFNISNSVVVRADLFDTDGKFTDVTPVFKFTPTIPNGDFHCYQFDFTNKWGSNTPVYGSSVNSSAIAGIRFYVDYGFYGKAASDSLWFNKLEITKDRLATAVVEPNVLSKIVVYPNPSSSMVTIQSPDAAGMLKEILVVDLHGRVEILKDGSGSSIDVSSLPVGAHMLILKYGSGIVSRLLIKN